MTDLRAARTERSTYVERRHVTVAGLFAATARILKTRFVDHRRVQNRGLSQLDILVCVNDVEATLRQVESTDALVVNSGTVEVVTNDERVIGVDGVVETWTEEHIAPRHEKSLTDVDRIEIVVEYHCPDEFVVVSFDTTEIDEERRFLRH